MVNIIYGVLVLIGLLLVFSSIGVLAVGTYPPVDPDMVLYYHFNNDSSVGENDTFVYDYSRCGTYI